MNAFNRMARFSDVELALLAMGLETISVLDHAKDQDRLQRQLQTELERRGIMKKLQKAV